ncbi:MAG: SAM-dependent methyltransferase [Terrimicrobiaceae bacterium]|nr:SAM-dependent methyltransferase [Terrimicrobiaceae bacterium]
MKSPGPEAGAAARLAEEIERGGPLAFSRFMEIALYDSAGGYYASGRAAVGKAGDFITNVSVGGVYGEIVAEVIREMHAALGAPENFTIVEQGAHDGLLARDIIDAVEGQFPYRIIEPVPLWGERQAATLGDREVTWVTHAGELPSFEGVHLSNELFDALPFDVVRSDGERWRHRHVGLADGRFVWCDGPSVEESLPQRPAGYTTEIRRDHGAVLRPLASRMKRGFVLAVDYGYPEEAFFAPFRSDGTLSCYRGHRRDADPLEDPGQKDITGHVNFTALTRDAAAAGFQPAGAADQYHFLVGAATGLLQALDGATSPEAARKLRALRLLLHPETMGRQFHALLFARGIDPVPVLSGFRHSRGTSLA